MTDEKIKFVVMVNGLPGKMATKVFERLISTSAERYGINFGTRMDSLTGPEINQDKIKIAGLEIHLIKPEKRKVIKDKYWPKDLPLIAVDFSHPSAVIDNANFYCSQKIPFVMGTTGGNRAELEDIVKKSRNCAVIAPNMAKQVVAFQSMMAFAAKNSPNAFKGYTLEIVESHQEGKADTSGTAKAMVEYFNALGIPFSKDQIIMIRDPKRQRVLGVPKEALSGHGWHTYTLRSSDKSVFFQFTHNINGRDIYAEGTLDAIGFLVKNIKPGKIYSMTDVLKGA